VWKEVAVIYFKAPACFGEQPKEFNNDNGLSGPILGQALLKFIWPLSSRTDKSVTDENQEYLQSRKHSPYFNWVLLLAIITVPTPTLLAGPVDDIRLR
jgi:hypothetical protein